MSPQSTPHAADGELDSALELALDRLPTSEPLVVLFSGGVDSGLLAWELRSRPGVRLWTFGLEGSSDPVAARASATVLGLPWGTTGTPEAEVMAMRARIEDWVGVLSPVESSIETAFALAVQTAPPGPLVCGQGADELFFGYAHYQGLGATEAATRGERDLHLLQETAWPRAQRIARWLGRSVTAPYLDPAFVKVAQSIPDSLRFSEGSPKSWFRAWAIGRGLSEQIALRPKKALQYGTGVDRLLRRRAPGP
jgi:asparagine synthase (glutamine-hydrolysing)